MYGVMPCVCVWQTCACMCVDLKHMVFIWVYYSACFAYGNVRGICSNQQPRAHNMWLRSIWQGKAISDKDVSMQASWLCCSAPQHVEPERHGAPYVI